MSFTLFWTFVKIGLFSFGGGYAILAMIQQEVVIRHQWLTASQFADVVAISQMTPGPIAINAATFIGFRRAGIPGALLCTFGVILPSLLLMLVITLTYLRLRQLPWFKNIFQKLRWLTLGLIGAAAILIGQNALLDQNSRPDWFALGVFAVSLAVYGKFRFNPIYLMLAAAAVGIALG